MNGNHIEFGVVDNKAELEDIIHLQGQQLPVVECEVSKVKMLNIDADELKQGDLPFIKALGLTISNPETDKPIALGEEYRTVGRKLADWFEDDDDDDDSGFFSGALAGAFLGSLSSGGGGFGGGFGGFGGGGFSGGGASGSF